MSELILEGCTPEPLMGYLKALGVLRLVSEQADPSARGCWRNGVFVLETALDEAGLAKFFLESYRPTPIIAPWAGGSGFFGPDNRTAVNAIVASRSDRLSEFAAIITQVRMILEQLGITTKPADETKEQLLREYRRRLPDCFVEWMDAVMVVQNAGQSFPPLLGTGGNDGRLDFTQNYMLRLTELGFPNSGLVENARGWLEQSLFGKIASGITRAAIGQFDPGRAGGSNATSGFEGDSLVNPWDFILLLEGSLLLGGAVTRRLGGHRDRAVFPFTVRAVPVGYASGADTEAEDSRGEVWLPIWAQPASLREVRHVFAEGRAEYNGRQSRDGLDFARSVATLGVDRGFASFIRYGFLKRSGKAFVAAPLGTFPVGQRRGVDLVQEFDNWLNRFRRACIADEVPQRFRTCRRRVETAIFELCQYAADQDSGRWVQAVVRALGSAERELSIGKYAQKPAKGMSVPRISPLGVLSADWFTAADDHSAEFRLARAVASIDEGKKETGPIRRNLEPVELNGSFWAWGEGGGHVVWNGGDLARNLGALLTRRLMDAEKKGEPLPPLGSPLPASLADVAKFLKGELDDAKLEEMIWGLSLVDCSQAIDVATSHEYAELPRSYALLKLTLLPGRLIWAKSPNGEPLLRVQRWAEADTPSGVAVKSEPAILAKLRAGDVQGACEVAARRLRASGFSIVGGFLADGTRRSVAWSAGEVRPERLLAALLFPIPDLVVHQLADLVLRSPKAETLV